MSGSSPLARGTHPREHSGSSKDRFIPARAGNTAQIPLAPGHVPVHPRSRGEHRGGSGRVLGVGGSSPLARGTRRAPGTAPRAARFIPARAGNTAGRRPARRRGSVHPRSRGEHRRGVGGAAHGDGSSPLARGTPRRSHAAAEPERFIPARAGNTTGTAGTGGRTPVHPRSRGEHVGDPAPHGALRRFIPARAGNTTRRGRRSPGAPVHPRSRGEHTPAAGAARGLPGSSPLARGTQWTRLTGSDRDRFIPARAGNTRRPTTCTHTSAVHPRSRGEHARHPRRRRRAGRFIPARAGNTCTWSPTPPSSPVHPRSRGEHGGTRAQRRTALGSSPLARGTPFGREQEWFVDRFIPARAGNTRRAVRRTRRTPVHPRSRGEHSQDEFVRNGLAGSSPLARGTPGRLAENGQAGRFIPARAGNTNSLSRSDWPTHGSSPLARGTPPATGKKYVIGRFIPARAGNTCYVWPSGARIYGSSPLARGTPPATGKKYVIGRFIPARAGNTVRARWRRGCWPVHPRSRGEHERLFKPRLLFDGSSPLARGTQTEPPIEPRRLRFIPARAGNTSTAR